MGQNTLTNIIIIIIIISLGQNKREKNTKYINDGTQLVFIVSKYIYSCSIENTVLFFKRRFSIEEK